MELIIPNRLTSLGHPHRLALFRLLMRRYPDRVPATELAQALGLKPNTFSSYVNALMRSGLVTQERVGTSLRYAIDIEAARETIGYLMNDCCKGRPDICAPNLMPNAIAESGDRGRKYNVLFICTGNSARSIFAESILRNIAGDRFTAYSAGTKPRSKLNPIALCVLEKNGHDTSNLRPKNITAFSDGDAPAFDFVFTTCNQAANEECATWPGQPISAHWGLADPADVEGTLAEKEAAFQETYGAMRERIMNLTNLSLTSMDRLALQLAVDNLAQDRTKGTSS